MRACRGGWTAVETLVSLLAVSALMAVMGSVLITMGRAFGTESERVDTDQVHGAAHALLADELGAGRPAQDAGTQGGDSLRVRAFRGTAWRCGAVSPGGPIHVAYSGDRAPSPAKDSVLALDGAGQWQVGSLVAVRGSSCPGVPVPAGVRVQEWTLSAGLAGLPVTALRLYESGTYHIASGALRYRTGRGGRQPVVGATLDTTSYLRPGPAHLMLGLVDAPAPYSAGRTTLRSVWPRPDVR